MRESVTQEFDFGCGIACFAFALNLTYKESVFLLGPEQASSPKFYVKDLAKALNDAGLNYKSKHIKPHIRAQIYCEGTIVLIRRSKRYPVGHYLIRHGGYWMDPWINLVFNKNINQAKSGFRKRLPGTPMYALMPQ